MHEQHTSRTYEDAFQRALQKSFEYLERVESDCKAAPDQMAELLDLSPSERKKALESKSRFHNYSLATHALARSEQELCRDPVMAWEIACLARSVIEKIDPQTCGGADALRDLSAYAVAVKGNTLRVRGDFRSALTACRNARILQRMGGGDLDLTANIDLLESSLRRDLWQFDSALALLNRATEIFVSLGEHERVARAVIGQANVYIVKGNWAQASTILRMALDWPLDSKLTLVARHNLADALLKAGRAPEAAQVFSEIRDLYDRYTDLLTTNRRLWLEALITRELGDLLRAEQLLEVATENFIAHGYAHDAALAQLDLLVTRKRLRASKRSGQRFPHSLHAGIAAAQQDAHATALETAINEDAGQRGGAGRLHDDFEMAGDQAQSGEDGRVGDGEDAGGVAPDQLEVAGSGLRRGEAVRHGLHPLGRGGRAGGQGTDDPVGSLRLDTIDPRARRETTGR